MGIKVADLYAAFSVKVDPRSFRALTKHMTQAQRIQYAQDKINLANQIRMERTLDRVRTARARVGLGLGLALGLAIKKGFEFNTEIENAKNHMAGMMAMARGTDLKDQFAEASKIVDGLAAKAVELPGHTKEYVDIMKTIGLPMMKAKATMSEIEEVTIATRTFSKLANTDAATGARGVQRVLMGNVLIRDLTIQKMVQAAGMEFETFRALAKTNKQAAMNVLLMGARSKQAKQLIEEENKSSLGQREEFFERVTRVLGKITLPLFKGFNKALKGVNEWLEKNSDTVTRLAEIVGEAFPYIIVAIGAFAAAWAVSWAVALAPILLVIAAIALVAYGVRQLIRFGPQIRSSIGGAWDWITGKIQAFVDWFRSIPAQAAAIAKAIGDAIVNYVNNAWDTVKRKAWQVINEIRRWVGLGGGDDPPASANAAPTTNVPPSAMSAPAGADAVASTGGGATPSMAVTIGSISIDAKNADAKQVKDVFANELAGALRHAQAATSGRVA